MDRQGTAWQPHPDPATELLLATGSRQALVAMLGRQDLRYDPYARLRALDRLVASGPPEPGLLEAWMQAMLLGNRPLPVWQLTRHWPEDERLDAGAQLLAAQVAQATGRHDEARRRYLHLLQRHPRWVDAWQKFIEFERHGSRPVPRPAVMEDILRAPPTPYDEEKAAFALATCLDVASPGEAFELAERGHALKHLRLGPWNQAALEERLRSDDAWTHRPPEASPMPREVFIVGLPRSGTTLLASILGSHSAIANVGEQDLLANLARGPFREPREAEPAQAGFAAAWYRAAVGDIAGPAPVVVDKMPANAERCGLALALLPGAIVVHIERNIDDCALSIHQHDFEFGCGYGSRGEDIGAYARLLSAHLASRRHRDPGRMLHLRFEDLVAAPRRTLAPLLAVLGLRWEPGMLGFWRREEQTATYSEGQVRVPLHTRAVGSSARYLPAAAGFLDAVHRAR